MDLSARIAGFAAPALLLGCATSANSGAWDSPGDPSALVASGPSAAVYNPAQRESTELDAIPAAVLAELGVASDSVAEDVIRNDTRLNAAAEDLARILPSDRPLPYEVVAFALQHHGVIEPTPRVQAAWSDPDDEGGVARFLADRLRPVLARQSVRRIGVGSALHPDGRQATVVLLLPTFIETGPIPRVASAGSKILITGKLRPPYFKPMVLVTRSDGTVERPFVSGSGWAGFAAALHCPAEPGRLQVEVAAVYSGGPDILANFPIWCGQDPPHRISLAPVPAEAPSLAAEEQRLWQMVNAAREEAGLWPLQLAAGVSHVARTYSERMAGSGVVAHRSPDGGSAKDRLRQADASWELVGENLAQASNLDEAHRGLMASPGHRINVLSTGATHIGIGLAERSDAGGARQLVVTQLFVSPPGVDLEEATARIVKRLRRKSRLRADPSLMRIANEHSQQLANDPSGRINRLTIPLRDSRLRFDGLQAVVTTIEDIERLDREAMAPATAAARSARRSMTHFGVGLAHSREHGTRRVFLVLLFARRV